ncbi:DNA polymerase delta, subunit 4-domain-containing protein [Auriculariales sp. MPI-PUGE-AT-0066]|nr:DNA polymerase delta, subunit 4-domain-containing protein [Auriculariales sp. MPI-PUGE-AT-0066]
MVSKKSDKVTKTTEKKQSRLSFQATKSSGPSASLKAKGKQQYARSHTASVTSGFESVPSSDEEEEDVKEVFAPAVRVTGRASGAGAGSSSQVAAPIDFEELDPKAARWNGAFKWAKEQTGHFQPVHKDKKDKVGHILRVFDNCSDYGPCVGITRLQRWERADAMGLEPPVAIRDILLTRQGQENNDIKESCFHDLADIV